MAILEIAINGLLQHELAVFLGYEKHAFIGGGAGNSRNGMYNREFCTCYGLLCLMIPRDRNDDFQTYRRVATAVVR